MVGLVGCTLSWSQGQYLLCLILAVSREGWRYVLKSPVWFLLPVLSVFYPYGRCFACSLLPSPPLCVCLHFGSYFFWRASLPRFVSWLVVLHLPLFF